MQNIGRKTTFEPTAEQGVSQKINNFRRLSESTKCVIGSGYCAGHNVKLERNIRMKKMSIIGKDGNIEWRLREFVTLECPAKKPAVPAYSATTVTSVIPESGVTNKKRRKSIDVKNDQPQLTRTSLTVKEDLRLDVTE